MLKWKMRKWNWRSQILQERYGAKMLFVWLFVLFDMSIELFSNFDWLLLSHTRDILERRCIDDVIHKCLFLYQKQIDSMLPTCVRQIFVLTT